mgnify:CR=1 FL=1
MSNETYHTKYGVFQGDADSCDSDYEKLAAALQQRTSTIVCPICQEQLYPVAQSGGSLVCPKHGTEPFETTR